MLISLYCLRLLEMATSTEKNYQCLVVSSLELLRYAASVRNGKTHCPRSPRRPRDLVVDWPCEPRRCIIWIAFGIDSLS